MSFLRGLEIFWPILYDIVRNEIMRENLGIFRWRKRLKTRKGLQLVTEKEYSVSKRIFRIETGRSVKSTTKDERAERFIDVLQRINWTGTNERRTFVCVCVCVCVPS
jgi:hypothetical protein